MNNFKEIIRFIALVGLLWPAKWYYKVLAKTRNELFLEKVIVSITNTRLCDLIRDLTNLRSRNLNKAKLYTNESKVIVKKPFLEKSE